MKAVTLESSTSFRTRLQTFPPVKYDLINPTLSNAENLSETIKKLVLAEHDKPLVTCPEITVSCLDDVVVNPNGSLLDLSGNVINESVHDFPPKMGYEKTTPLSTSDHPGILLFKYGFRNYGHWLIEMLPKLHFLQNTLRDNPECKILIGDTKGAMRDIAYSTLAKFGVNKDSTIPIEYSTKFKTLFYCSPITKHPFMMRPEITQFYSKHAKKCLEPNNKLFITRPLNGNRVLSDLKTVESYFRNRGYIVLNPGTLSFDEQVEVFRKAGIVVGIAGAAMTNTVFCAKDTKVVHIAPPSMPNLFFYQLASICNHQYYEFRGYADTGMFGNSFDANFDELCHFIENIDASISN